MAWPAMVAGVFAASVLMGSVGVASDRLASREEWPGLRQVLNTYDALYERPIPTLLDNNAIPDAPLCGGGKLTVAVDGDARAASYHITKSDFWVGILAPENLFPRSKIRHNPFCRLALTIRNSAPEPAGFRHVQDMATAEIRSVHPTEGGTLEVRTVALAQEDVVLFGLTATGTKAAVTVDLQSDNERQNFFLARGIRDGATIYLRKEHKSFITVNAAAAVKAIGVANVVQPYDKGFQSRLEFEVVPGAPAYLVMAAGGGKDAFDHLEQAFARLDGVTPETIPGLIEGHREWWRDYWLKSWVQLGDPVLERYYYGALYVLGTTLDLDSRVTPGLAGGWITNPNPLWGGTYTMNYNGEAPFWGLFSSNRGEWILPYARVCLDYTPAGRLMARETGTSGIVFPVMIGPWGTEDNPDALGQKGNASMAALSLICYEDYHRDRAFLEEYAYPFVRELATFWEDNIEPDDSGRHVILGASRERDPGDLNPANDLAYARRVLDAAIRFSEELGVDGDARKRWRELLDGLSDYPTIVIDGKLCFSEAENRQVVGTLGEYGTLGVGDNPVALDHVYPGGALDASGNERGRIIARNTLRYLGSWRQGNGFPRIFSQGVRARYPGSELLGYFRERLAGPGKGRYEHLRANNTFLPDDHAYEGTGSLEFLNSLLANAHDGTIRIFDLWPDDRDAAFRRIRVRGAFLVSARQKHGEAAEVEIASEKGGVCRMRSCWPSHAVEVRLVRADGKSSPVTVKAGDGVCSWETEAGASYAVTKGAAVAVKESNPPEMLVPVVDPAAAQGLKYTNAAMDLLLNWEISSTRLKINLVRADESVEDCTDRCRFSSRDEHIATVSGEGVVSGVGSGRVTIDVTAEIDGVELKAPVRCHVLKNRVVPGVKASSPLSDKGLGNPGWANRPECLVGSGGTDGPDITARHRANGYRVGMYRMDTTGDKAVLVFDLGKVYTLDEMWVWNFNAPEDYRVIARYAGGRLCGMRDVTIETSLDGKTWTALRDGDYPFRLAMASGEQWIPATNLDDGKASPLSFGGTRARYVRVRPHPDKGIGNWGGDAYGLSEVRFTYSAAGEN